MTIDKYLTPAMTNDKYLPLVSFRSPSFSRALRELDDTGLRIEANAVASLNRLVEAENDARLVCQKVADETQNQDIATHTHELALDHAERQGLVGTLVKKLGGSPPDRKHCRATLQFGPQFFEGMSDPEDIEGALGKMYTELRAEYLRCQAIELPSSIHEALEEMSPVARQA